MRIHLTDFAARVFLFKYIIIYLFNYNINVHRFMLRNVARGGFGGLGPPSSLSFSPKNHTVHTFYFWTPPPPKEKSWLRAWTMHI